MICLNPVATFKSPLLLWDVDNFKHQRSSLKTGFYADYFYAIDL